MKRRILSMFLSLVCLLSLLPTSVFAADASGTVPDIVTLNYCEYNTAIKNYQSDKLGECWLHVFNFNVNGEVMSAFCADHEKDLSNALKGKKWKNPTLVEDEYINAFLNYYYYKEEQAGTDVDAVWDLKYLLNPWIQACVWLAEEGFFVGKTHDEIVELCARERQTILKKWNKDGTWYGTEWDSNTNSAGNWVQSSKDVAEIVLKHTATHAVYHYDYAETETVGKYTPQNTQAIYVLLTDEPLEGAKIKVKKVDADSGVALAGAEFSVIRSDTGRTVATLTTGTDGTAVTENLDINATYTVTETKAPNGYTIDDATKSQTVTLTEDTTVTLTFKDKASGEPLSCTSTGTTTQIFAKHLISRTK